MAIADVGATELTVDKALDDWAVGAKIFLGPTGHKATQSDYAEIKAYDTATGKLTLTQPLKYYHYGAAESTSAKYKHA